MSMLAIRAFKPLRQEPAEFDALWQATLLSLDQTAPEPLSQRSAPPRPGLTLDRLSFTSLGGEPILGYLMSHDDGEQRPLVVHTHGYNSQYDIMLEWALAGYHVCGIDVRGHGRSASRPRSSDGYVLTGIDTPQTSILRGAVMDVVQAIRVARLLLSWRVARTVLQGFSFGGALAVMAGALVSDLDLVVAGQPTLGWHAERVRLAEAGSSLELRRFLDAAPHRASQVNATLAYYDALHFAHRLRVPCFIGVGLADSVVPSRTVLAIANHITGAPAELRLLPVAHSDDPRESLWNRFDAEWLALGQRSALPADFGTGARQLQLINS
ncbi:MAG: alpha/beta fold hydrolase [Pseudomonadota bacterium]